MESMERLFEYAREKRASDIHIGRGELFMRKNGEIVRIETEEDRTEEMIRVILSKSRERKENFSFSPLPGMRVRVHAYFSMGSRCLALRILPERIPDPSSVSIPSALLNAGLQKTGLILICGPTGSGKSTTLASMIKMCAVKRRIAIITLEDPVEYDFSTVKESRSMIRQRELGRDFQDYAQGIRDAMREDPDILMIGELRGRDAAEQALCAAETGHLVYATLHTSSCAQSVDRLVEMFPGPEREEKRRIVAQTLVAVCCQRLIPSVREGRIAAREILLASPAVSTLIREGKTHQITNIIQTSSDLGMSMFDCELAKLVVQGKVSEKEAAGYAADYRQLSRYLQAYS